VILHWTVDNQPLADAEMVAALYEVSTRSVRRHCPPVEHEPRLGRPRGRGGLAWYDAYAAGEHLAGVAPRPGRTVAALRFRMVRQRARETERRGLAS
jgi:hypothetical protein